VSDEVNARVGTFYTSRPNAIPPKSSDLIGVSLLSMIAVDKPAAVYCDAS